jgi:dolichol-phosphate mannosyltransferase
LSAHPNTLVIIPTYNERENLERLLGEIHQVDGALHILIVDDGSPDGTGALADQLAAADERIHVMHREGKLGLGTAYIAGFKWALKRDYELVFEMDADFSHEPEALPRFIEAVANGADLVIGSRWVPGGETPGWPAWRKGISRGGSMYARTVLGVDVRDLTSGFKCFHRRVLQAIDLDSVEAVGYGFQVELNWRTLRRGFKVVEVPICFRDRAAGQSKMSSKIFAEALVLVVKLRLGG